MTERSQGELVARLATLDEVEVTVEKLVAGGDGIARHDGIPLFIPRSVPGDRLLVRVVERRPDYGRAEIVEVLAAGEGRREPPCPYFADCGGCDLQQIDDRLQSELKLEAVKETLQRIARLPWPEKAELITGEPWGYRLRAQLHTERLAGERDGAAGEEVAVGYHARGSKRLVPVASCPILAPELEALLAQLPSTLGSKPPRRIDLTVGNSGTVVAAPRLEQLADSEVTIEAGGFTFAFDARCFFQAHRGLLDELVRRVVGDDGEEGGTAFDLYCGVGLFALPLARRYGRVVAVEGTSVAARFARNNARRNRLQNVEVVTQAVETWVQQLPADADRVVVDPPRTGLHRQLLAALVERPAKRLTYVSCHAATLARDLRSLTDRYSLDSVAVVDLFPQTGHVETVAQLTRVSE